MSIIRFGFMGALGLGILAFSPLVLVNLFMPHDTNEGKAWVEFALIMLGLSGVVVGFAVGAIYGTIQAFRARKKDAAVQERTLGAAKDGARLHPPTDGVSK